MWVQEGVSESEEEGAGVGEDVGVGVGEGKRLGVGAGEGQHGILETVGLSPVVHGTKTGLRVDEAGLGGTLPKYTGLRVLSGSTQYQATKRLVWKNLP